MSKAENSRRDPRIELAVYERACPHNETIRARRAVGDRSGRILKDGAVFEDDVCVAVWMDVGGKHLLRDMQGAAIKVNRPDPRHPDRSREEAIEAVRADEMGLLTRSIALWRSGELPTREGVERDAAQAQKNREVQRARDLDSMRDDLLATHGAALYAAVRVARDTLTPDQVAALSAADRAAFEFGAAALARVSADFDSYKEAKSAEWSAEDATRETRVSVADAVRRAALQAARAKAARRKPKPGVE